MIVGLSWVGSCSEEGVLGSCVSGSVDCSVWAMEDSMVAWSSFSSTAGAVSFCFLSSASSHLISYRKMLFFNNRCYFLDGF